jgi:DNA-directed RNA polymerase specialized sigma24 family protein
MPDRGEPDDGAGDELLHRARAGDQRAVERLLGFVRIRTVPVALRQVADQPEAEDLAQDIVQETLVRALAHLNDCRADTLGQFVSWAHAIATRVVLDERRRPFGLVADVEVRVNLEAEHHPSVEMPTLEDDADYHGITAVTLMLAAAAGAHGDAQGDVTDVVTVRILGGAPWSAIAADLGTTPGGAKRRFQRMIARLRRETLRRLGTLRAEQRASVVALMRSRGVAGWEVLIAADPTSGIVAGTQGPSSTRADPTDAAPRGEA